MEDRKLLRNAELGQKAQDVLDNEAFQLAFETIEQELSDAWKQSPVRDQEGRESIFRALTMLGKVKQALTETINTGKLARLELNHLNPTIREQSRSWIAE